MQDNKNPLFSYTPQPKTEENKMQSITESLRSKYSAPQATQAPQGSAFDAPISSLASNDDYKVSFQTFDTPFDEVYTQLSDGSAQAMFPNYIGGTDNRERLAQQQTSGEKWKNGAIKALGNVGTTLLAGTAGSVVGIAELIKTGSLASIYDNDFSNNLMNLNEKWGHQLPNYYTQEENDMNLFESAGTANFWADKVLHGLSFTVGMLASETVWAAATGGASLVGAGARGLARGGFGGFKTATQLAKANSKVAGQIKNLVRSGEWSAKEARQVGRVIEGANALRFTYTSAGAEAGIEALSFKREATANFERSIQEQFGRQPNTDEWAEFKEELNSTANSVYATNLALVGSSNLAIFGNMFNIHNPFKAASRSANKSLFGIGFEETTREGKKIFEALKPTKLQKFAGTSYGILKAPVIEGIWEEGMQSVTQNSAKTFLESSYDPKSSKENIGIMESIYEGFSETYGSKEGWKEVGVGMIVGLFGGGISGSFNEVNRARKSFDSNLAYLNTFSAENTMEMWKAANGISKAMEDAKTADQNNDLLGKDLATRRMLYFNAMANERMGRDDAAEDFRTALEGLPNEYFEEIGLDPQNEEQISTLKEDLYNQYLDVQSKYKTNKATARYMIGSGQIAGLSDTSALQEAVAYSLTMGENSEDFAGKAFEQIKAEFASAGVMGTKATEGLKVEEALAKAAKNTREKFYYHRGRVRKFQRNVEEATKKLRNLQTESRKENVDIAEKLQSAQNSLNTYTERLAQEKQNMEQTFAVARAENPYNTSAEFISAEAIEKSDDYLKEAEGYLKTIETSNPVKFRTINKLLNEYRKANYAFKQFNDVVQKLSSDELEITEFSNFLSAKLYKGKEPNEFTKEFFTNQLNSYVEAYENSYSDAEAQQLEYNRRTAETVEEKLFTKTDLTSQEKEFYETNKEAVDKRVRQRQIANLIVENDQNFLTGEDLDFYNANKEAIDAIVEKENAGDSINVTPPVSTQPTPQTLDDRIKNAINNSETLMRYVGNTIEEVEAAVPTETERERFKELDNKKRTEEEEQEYQNLIDKISKWGLVDGTLDPDGYSLADMLKIRNQQKEKPASNNTKKELTEQENIKVATVEEKDGSKTVDNVNFIQTYENTKVKVSEDGNNYVFSHLNIESIISNYQTDQVRVNRPGSKTRVLTPELLSTYRKMENTVFEITLENGDKVAVKVEGEEARLSIPIDQFNKITDDLGFKLVNPNLNKNTYFDVYTQVEINGQTEFIPRPADFKLETITKGNVVMLEPQEIENLKKGDVLEFKISKESRFNTQLEEQYKAAKTEKEKDAAFKKIRNSLEIYVQTPDGRVVGVVKAAKKKFNANKDAQVNHLSLRQIAANKFIQEIDNMSRSFLLDSTIPVSNVLFGTPNLSLREENGNLVPNNINISDEALEQVIDFGYKEGSDINTRNNLSDINTMFLSDLGKNEKVPFVVFKHNNQNIAYPVSLITTIENASEAVVDINNTPADVLSVSEKIVQINDILLENGISPNKYDLVNANINNIDSKIAEIVEELSQREIKPDLDNWLNSDKSILQREAVISIDLTNRPFKAPKLMVDFSNTEFNENIEQEENEELDIEETIEEVKVESKVIKLKPDTTFETFARENGVEEFRNHSFMGAKVVSGVTENDNDWSGKGSSFSGTWDVAKYNQGQQYAHVRILMTPEQKNKQTKAHPDYDASFHENLKTLARNVRDREYVVLLDVRNAGKTKSLKSEVNEIQKTDCSK